MKPVIISPAAVSDLEEIWIYIALDSVKAADSFIEKLTEKCHHLNDYPSAGKSRDELMQGLRSWSIGQYLIFYRETSTCIEIIRVIHGSKDIDNLF